MPTRFVQSKSDIIWSEWNDLYVSRGKRLKQADRIWTAWNETPGQYFSSKLSTEIWSGWNKEYMRQVAPSERPVAPQPARPVAPANRNRIEVVRSEADLRAEKLLQRTLSGQQKEDLASKGYFTLETISSTGERRFYRIHRGRSRNVRQVDAEGHILRTLCAHPIELVPDADTMLAQKLMLESSEEEFLRMANQS